MLGMMPSLFLSLFRQFLGAWEGWKLLCPFLARDLRVSGLKRVSCDRFATASASGSFIMRPLIIRFFGNDLLLTSRDISSDSLLTSH
ncbi:hypothetical protein B0T24DRAFT_144539 [Lasiosphaeria ovina]|uniref:Secreted protein n=1 Tax=Lasiosphaeria ovina TaxID=92902 RepID=A0AAE0KMN3_9PEZI|nr:hypothetical protein B0T24DRAFT_144539 [Lasiosphaeria ovina]